ncbi:MAG: fumarylacetoacetate hydrolase family protein [Ginsengibacter sp.]
MKLVSYNKDEQDQLAILEDGLLYDTDLLHPDLPVSMSMFLNYWDHVYAITAAINKKLEDGKISRQQGIDNDLVEILPPVPHATSSRNAAAFRQHFTAYADRAFILPEFDKNPIFYFKNHNCFQGPGDIICMPGHLKKLDFELQAAIVICKAGKNIKVADADEYIGGYMIMNNINTRNFLSDEIAWGGSSASGNGFATPIGPMLVTPDELEAYKVECKPNHTGNAYNLSMTCSVNGTPVSEGSLADMDWTFAEIIEQASYGVQLFPGDIIGSGAVGTGCFLELNTTGKINDPDYKEQWLQEGDVVEMEIEGLGKLINTIVKEESELPDLEIESLE